MLKLVVNGRERQIEGLEAPCALHEVLRSMELRADRIAVELNGELAPRTGWTDTLVGEGDRLEVVHFVGGGCSQGLR